MCTAHNSTSIEAVWMAIGWAKRERERISAMNEKKTTQHKCCELAF